MKKIDHTIPYQQGHFPRVEASVLSDLALNKHGGGEGSDPTDATKAVTTLQTLKCFDLQYETFTGSLSYY